MNSTSSLRKTQEFAYTSHPCRPAGRLTGAMATMGSPGSGRYGKRASHSGRRARPRVMFPSAQQDGEAVEEQA